MTTGPPLFPGQYFDQESGLNYNYFRDYDPRTGRYLEPDPVGLDGGYNLYLYSQGNPITNVDILGLNPNDVVNWSTKNVDSGEYSYWSSHPEIRGFSGAYLHGRFSNKCNVFVYDALKAGSCDAGRVDKGRVPLASEWANPNFEIPGCTVVTEPEPGDVVAYNGHVGIYAPITPNLKSTISAKSPTPIVWNNWGFRSGQKPTFRRCVCK